MFGSATPKPYEKLLAALGEQGCSVPTLHSISAVDRMNPPEMGEEVARCFEPLAEVLWHSDGHAIPPLADDADGGMARVAAFLERAWEAA